MSEVYVKFRGDQGAEIWRGGGPSEPPPPSHMRLEIAQYS